MSSSNARLRGGPPRHDRREGIRGALLALALLALSGCYLSHGGEVGVPCPDAICAEGNACVECSEGARRCQSLDLPTDPGCVLLHCDGPEDCDEGLECRASEIDASYVACLPP